ncbi:MAG: dimethylargininase [Ahniella sp.]|nr:dimethylargininase [Ahniella sp.]
MILLTRRPGNMAAAELTFMHRDPIDAALAELQHTAYRTALAAVTLAQIDLPALDGHADATFVEDTLLAFPEIFVLCRPGAVSRQGEVDSIAAALPKDRPLVRLAAPVTIDGGDVLRIGKTVYVGLSTRTNSAAITALTETLQPSGYEVVAVNVPGALHLKTAVTSPAPGLVVINRNWVDADVFAGFEQIHVSADEPFSGNTLPVGDRVFVQGLHPRTAEQLARRGIAVQLLDISEFAKAEAGLTCMSVVIPESSVR